MFKAYWYNEFDEVCGAVEGDNQKSLKSEIIKALFDGINWQADYDTLSTFGNVKYHDGDLNTYFEELHFNDTQRRAYMDARKQYFAETEDEY